MSTPKDTGGAAFPVIPPLDPQGGSSVGYPFPEIGMALRDFFAAQALVSMGMYDPRHAEGERLKAKAEWAYAIADAMLEARKA